jgi:3-dehydroquinate dehydratase/shikimate dehydrogenase
MASALAREVNGEALSRRRIADNRFDAIINATPIGMHPHAEDSPLRASELDCQIVFDLVYRPLETKLLRHARRRGIQVISGVEMFIAQGVAQWELWQGERAPVAAMRAAVLRALKK